MTMDACKSAIFAFHFVTSILQTITHQIQYTVLETRFWSVKCTTVTVRYAKILSIFIPSHRHQAMQAIAMIRLYVNKPLQNVFKRIQHYICIFKLYTQFVRGFPPPPPFSKQPLFDPACPTLFKIFVSALLFSVAPPFKVFQTVPPTLTQPLTALIRPTNLPWFKQISKERLYQFNCRFLSKINFRSFKSLYKQVILIYGLFSGSILDNLA